MARLAAATPPLPRRSTRRRIGSLTEREKDVLHLLAPAAPTSRSPTRLGVGEATAKTHVSRVLMKLGVRDRVQAVIVAHERASPRRRARSG